MLKHSKKNESGETGKVAATEWGGSSGLYIEPFLDAHSPYIKNSDSENQPADSWTKVLCVIFAVRI